MFGVYKSTEGKDDSALMTVTVEDEKKEFEVFAIFPNRDKAERFAIQQDQGWKEPYKVYTVRTIGSVDFSACEKQLEAMDRELVELDKLGDDPIAVNKRTRLVMKRNQLQDQWQSSILSQAQLMSMDQS